MKSFKKIVAGVCSLLMLSTVATSVAFAELGDSLGLSDNTPGTSDDVTPGESDPVVPGDSDPVVPGESDPVVPGESDPVAPPTPTGVMGDANGDGVVRVNDVQAIRMVLLHLEDETSINFTESDVNKDGRIRVNDIQLIRQYILHLIDSLDDVTLGDSN